MVAESKQAAKTRLARKAAVERRREARYPCNEPAEVRNLSVDGSRIPATLTDVSRSGMRVEVGVPLMKGVQVEVILRQQDGIVGRVRHCRQIGARYQVGILILDASHAFNAAEHISNGHLKAYLTGSGLTLTQAIRVRDHLAHCDDCRLRAVETYTSPAKPRKS